MTGETDTALVRKCLKGESIAFERILDKYERVVFNTALRMVKDTRDAEELTQSVFVRVYERLSTFNPRYKFFSWLYRIVVNECLNHLKLRKHHQQLGEAEDASQNPEERFEGLEKEEKISQALLKLDVNQRIVIVLRHFHDLSYREMSQILDIPVKRVKSRLFTARQVLRMHLIKMGIAR